MKLFSLNPVLFGGMICVLASSIWGQLDVRDGLLSDYPLDETGGIDARDAVQNFRLRAQNGNPNWINPGVLFNASERNHFKFIEATPGVREHFTLSAWVKPTTTSGWQGVLDFASLRMITIEGKPVLEVVADGDPIFNEGSTGFGQYSADTALQAGVWHHLAISGNGHRIRLYIDGEIDKEHSARVISNETNNFLVGVRDDGLIDYFNGSIRGVRVYGRELTTQEVAILHDPPEPSETMVGLWVGEANLDEVKEVATGQWGPAESPFSSRVIVRSDQLGNLTLLQEAVLMRTREAESQEAVISDPNLIANYDGVLPKGDALVGMRFSSATFPMPGNQLAFSETGAGDEAGVTITLPGNHPKNPFRHKYHPDLGGGRAFTRTVLIDWVDEDSPDDGVRQAVLTEKISGLHKETLEARGPVTFTRVSMSPLLNP